MLIYRYKVFAKDAIMRKSYLRNFAVVLSLVLVFAMTLSVAFGAIDAHVFAPSNLSYAVDGATESDDYYANVEALDDNVTGTAFRSQLATLIGPTSSGGTHSTLTTWDGLKNVYKLSDSSQEGYVTWFFTGTIASYNGNMGSGTGLTNREHVWPKKGGDAYEDQKSNVGSDAHHLRPVEGTFNSSHNDSQFDEVEEIVSNIIAENGTTNYSNLCYESNGSFMPGVGYRGATARILMYVQTRWGDTYGLKFTTETNSSNPKLIGNIATLMKWHLEEPVTEEEKLRNEEVYKIQGNRNPFIDHPEYAARIYCYDGNDYNQAVQEVVEENSGDEPIESITLNKTDATTHIGERVFLSADLMPSNAIRDLKWESSNTAVATVDSTGIVTPVSAGTAEITVYSESTPTKKATASITVVALQEIKIEGTPNVTEYKEGSSFDFTGLTVKAIYSDDTEKNGIDVTSKCQWLDATTQKTALSAGTTSVICKFEDKELLINGITVTQRKGVTKTITITSASSSDIINKYGWRNWTQSGIKGEIYAVKGDSTHHNCIQMHNKTQPYASIFNSTPIQGKLVSIKITLDDGETQTERKFTIYTSNTPYTQSTCKNPTSGTNQGVKEVTTNGTTWNLDTTDKYFTINFTSSARAVYISSIEIVYEECAEHEYGEWTTTKEPTATEEGEKSHTCINCGHIETQKIDALGTSGEGGNQGGNTGTEGGNTDDGNTDIGDNTGGNTGTEDKNDTPNTDNTPTIDDFKNAVEAIKSASTPEEKQEAIDYAESLYNSLPIASRNKADAINAFRELHAQQEALKKLLESDGDSGLGAGAIAGIVIGCVALVAIITVAVIFIVKAKKNKDENIEMNE